MLINGLVMGKMNQDYTLYIVFVWHAYHWLIWPEGGRVECDDFHGGVSAGDFWKIYVR